MPRKFSFPMDLTVKENHEGFHDIVKCPLSAGHAELIEAAKSSGDVASSSSQQSAALAAKKQARAMSIATKPGQQILMNAFMMYMGGKQLNIFTISTTSSAILTPITSIIQMDKPFASLDLESQLPKLIYVALNLVWLALGLYKMSSMRLLPTTSADWADKVEWKDMMEFSSIPPSF